MAYTPDRTKAVEHQLLDAIEYQIAHPITVDGGDIEIGAVELKDHTSDLRAKVVAGSSAAAGDVAVVVADANVLAKMPAKGTAAMAASVPVTIATDDTILLAAKNDLDKIPSKGTAAMAGATPVTIATDDTILLAVKNDVDKIPSKGTAAMAASTPVTIATDDTILLAVKNDVDKIPAKGTAAMAASMPVTLATDDSLFGATTTAPVADNTTVEDGTARTGISLWKRIANCLIAILGKLPEVGTAGTASANVLSVQGIASGTNLDVAVASIALTESAPVNESAVVAAGPAAAPIAVANGTFATGAVVTAKAGNTATIYVGTSAVQSKPLVAGESFSIVCGAGRKTDLNDWYIFGTAGEGVDTLYTGV